VLIVLSHYRNPADDIEKEAAAAAGVDLHFHRTTIADPAPLPVEVRRKAVGIIHYPANVLVDGTPDDYPKLKALMRYGVGFDNIDTALWGRRGVAVLNIPDYGTSEVSDHAIALMLALVRGTSVYHEAVRDDPVGGWKFGGAPLMRRLRGDVFGVIGLGRMGTAAALRARGFGMQIAFYDPFLPRGFEISVGARRCETLAELMSISSIVSVHAPGSAATAGLVGREAFSHARKDLVLINTARGMIVDLDALFEALKSDQIGGAGLDVLPVEPADKNHPLIAAFTRREPWLHGRLTISPHAAFYSPDAVRDMRTKGMAGMIRCLKSGDLDYCVNKHQLQGWPGLASAGVAI
jgi:lactate dehydrogenase-like 2-hydroxyacid dehydrogenase